MGAKLKGIKFGRKRFINRGQVRKLKQEGRRSIRLNKQVLNLSLFLI